MNAPNGGVSVVGVFTGAGLSHDAPAQLPMGWTLRDAVIERCHRAAEGIAPEAVSGGRLGRLDALDWKLEYVLGRLHGTMGDAALEVLSALRVDVPNEGHLLAAALLARGGVHVTLNFDEGVERAYALLSGGSDGAVARALPRAFEEALAAWRDAVGPVSSSLQVVASPEELRSWPVSNDPEARAGPLLVKLHGGVRTREGTTKPYHPVVTDEVELAQLSNDQRRALSVLDVCDLLVVTGYSGEDIDCYEPLLEVLERRDGAPTVWADPGTLRPGVATTLARLDVAHEPVDAVTALRRQGLEHLPAWPRIARTPPPWREAFDAWSHEVDDLQAAESYGWMLIDAGELAEAAGILRQVLARQAPVNPRTIVRLADALYDSGHDKRGEAMTCYRQVLRRFRPSGGLATYSWVRWGECHRPCPGVTNRAATLLGPSMGVFIARWDRAPHHVRARVLNSLAHTLARLSEQLAPGILRSGRGRRAAAVLLGLVDLLQRRALGELDRMDVPMGNRRSVIVYERIEGLALRALLLRRQVDADAPLRSLAEVRRSYERMPDRRGVANTHAAEALVRAAQRRPDEAEAELDGRRSRTPPGAPSRAGRDRGHRGPWSGGAERLRGSRPRTADVPS